MNYKLQLSRERTVFAAILIGAIVFISLGSAFSSKAFAAGGGGTGGGTGNGGGSGGGSAALTLSGAVAATIDGNVSTNGVAVEGAVLPKQPIIKLIFTVNVVDASVWPTPNQNAITMKDSKGASVPVEVFRIDPAANFEERDFIFLKPLKPLAAGEKYGITVDSALTGNNGQTMAAPVTVSFTAEGTKQPAEEQEAVATTAKPNKTTGKTDNSSGWPASSWVIIIGAIAAIVIIAGGIVYKNIKKKP
jgi:hypothetical protein